MSEIETWVVIRRYDTLETGNAEPEAHLQLFTLTPDMDFEELKASLFRWIDVKNDGTKVMKIRQHDNSLIPLLTLLNGAPKDKPFMIDVIRVHQFIPVEPRTFTPDYVETLRRSLNHLDKRVTSAERVMKNFEATHQKKFDDAVNRMKDCVSFLDRRLDELAPPAWRNQATAAI